MKALDEDEWRRQHRPKSESAPRRAGIEKCVLWKKFHHWSGDIYFHSFRPAPSI